MICMALSLSVFTGVQMAFAADIPVDISGATTDLQRGAALRAAISTAVDGDTVVIPAGTYDVASGGAGINVGAKAINLRGAGSGQTILDGSHITSTAAAYAAIFKQRIDDTSKTITYSGITFQNGGTNKSSGIDFLCYHDATPSVSSTLVLNDIAVIGNKNAGVNINSAKVIANGLQSSGNAVAGVSIGDLHGSASFVGNDYSFTETKSMASTVNQKVGVYIDKANTAYTVSASYKDAMKVAQSVFWSSAKATETPVDNFVVTGGGISSLFYLGLPDPTSITLPTGLKTLTEDGTAIPMTENQFSFDVSEAVSNGAVATGTTFTPTMSADGTITFSAGAIPISSAGTYTYTVRETGTVPGYTQDTNYYEISYVVSKGATALTASSPTITKYDSEGNLLAGTEIKFENTRLRFAVSYDGNGNTSGTAPTDASSPYHLDDVATVLGGDAISRTGYIFTGWNTEPDGTGTSYAAGTTFAVTHDVVLYAQWASAPSVASPNITKTVSGSDPSLSGRTFHFTIAANANNPVGGESGLSTTADIAGSKLVDSNPYTLIAAFGTATFTKTGTYVYTITETPGTDTGYTYDTSTYTWTVVVADNGEAIADNVESGAFTTTATLTNSNGSAVTTASFANTYTAPKIPAKISPTSSIIPQTGDQTSLVSSIAVLLLAISTGIVGISLKIRRETSR